MTERRSNKPRASRARATPGDIEARVLVVEGLMRALAWKRGRSNRELAAKWGVSVGTVDDYAAEASRRVRASLTDRDEVTETVSARMRNIVEGGTDGDAIKAGDVWTRVVGAVAPAKSEITITAKELELLPPSALLARIRDQRARLDEAERRLLDEHPELAPKVIDTESVQ